MSARFQLHLQSGFLLAVPFDFQLSTLNLLSLIHYVVASSLLCASVPSCFKKILNSIAFTRIVTNDATRAAVDVVYPNNRTTPNHATNFPASTSATNSKMIRHADPHVRGSISIPTDTKNTATNASRSGIV